MQLVLGLHNLRPQHRGCVATIGNFDGVHRGHQAILGRLRERALELGVPSCVVIFEPQPREFFAPDTAPARLARLRDKLQLLADAGVDRMLCLAFNQRLCKLSAARSSIPFWSTAWACSIWRSVTTSVLAAIASAILTFCSRLARCRVSPSRRRKRLKRWRTHQQHQGA